MAVRFDPDVSTRARLVDAATEVFAEVGYEEAHVQEIASRAGFTTGAIYGQFTGKPDLLAAVVAVHGHAWLDALEAFTRSGAGSAADLLITLAVDTQTASASPYQRILADACAVAARDLRVREALRPVLEQVRSGIEATLVRAQAEGTIDRSLPADAIVHFALTLMLGGLFARALALQQPSKSDAGEVLSRVVGTFAPPSIVDLHDDRISLD